MISLYLGLEGNEVLDGVVDDERYCELVDDLLKENGRSAIMFYYQDGGPPTMGTWRSFYSLMKIVKMFLIFRDWKIQSTTSTENCYETNYRNRWERRTSYWKGYIGVPN